MNKENIHSLSSGNLRWNKTKNLHILTSANNILKNSQLPNIALGPNEYIKFGSPRVEKKIENVVRNPQAQVLEGYFPSALSFTQSIVPNFVGLLQGQSNINMELRNHQVEWLFSMRETFRLSEQTIFHAILYMDMYLMQRMVSMDELPLLATVCLLISSKNNEIYQIKIAKLIEQRKRLYDRQDILNMENDVLLALNFNLAVPSLYELYRVNQMNYQLYQDNLLPVRGQLISLVLKLCLCDPVMMDYGYSMSALACVVLFSKYRTIPNRAQHNELQGLKLKSMALSRACDRLSELVSDAKLQSRLGMLLGRNTSNNPESSTKYIVDH